MIFVEQKYKPGGIEYGKSHTQGDEPCISVRIRIVN